MTKAYGHVVRAVLIAGLGALSTGTAAAQDQRQIEERKVAERKVTERKSVELAVAQRAVDQLRVQQLKIVEAQVAAQAEERKVTERLREAALKMRQAQITSQPPGGRATNGFSVVLVLGDLQGASSNASDVPEAARKALDDMKEFLPYKSYRLLDAAWILGEGQLTSQLRGIDEHPYSLELTASRTPSLTAMSRSGGLLQMRVRLEEVVGGSSRPEVILNRVLELNRKGLVPQSDVDREVAKVQEARSAERPVVATSFSMDPGETVVVGTSRINGDKALILLLTAVPASAAGRSTPAGR